MILGAIDDRIAASLPAVMVSEAMQGGCVCENAQYLRINQGNIDIAAATAPRPLGLIAADDWTKELETKGYPDLKKLYQMLGHVECFEAHFHLKFPHNYNYVSRAVMYHWFNNHLKLGLAEPILEEDFQPLSIAEMSVWDSRHPPPPSGPDYERSLLQRMTDDSQQQIEALVPKDAASLQEYHRIVGGAVETMVGRSLPDSNAVEVADLQSEELGPYRMTKFLLRYPAQGEELPVIRLDPATWNQGVIIWVDHLGKQGMFTSEGNLRDGVQNLLEKGFAMIGADLIGQGEFTLEGKPLAKARMNTSKDAKLNESWGRYAGFTFGYNRPLFAQRVHDVLSLVAFAHSDNLAAERVDVVGLGGAGHWVAAARAIAGNAIDRAAIDTTGFRFVNLTAIDDPDFLPGGAKYDDLPGMIVLSAPNALWLAGEGNALPPVVRAAYQAASAENKITAFAGSEDQKVTAALEWLRGQ